MKVIFKTSDGNTEQTIDVSPDSKLGENRESAQMLLGLPENPPCKLILERTKKELKDSLTVREAGIKTNDSIILSSKPIPEVKTSIPPPTPIPEVKTSTSNSKKRSKGIIIGSIIGFFTLILLMNNNSNNYSDNNQPPYDETPKPQRDVVETNATVSGTTGIKNIRSGPGTDYSIAGQISTGSRVKILDEGRDRGGYLWYKIYDPTSKTQGWMAAQLITTDLF